MAFLYETIEGWRSGGFIKDMPTYIAENLNPNFELRPYQTAAFENFVSYFENDMVCAKPTKTLFHMATGSGKTLIMAGLMLYLYKQGYRNFLFFVNLSNIVNKTKDNFLNAASTKYLFADEIRINGETIKVKEVSNFQYSAPDSINICFNTTQGLHTDMWFAKENAVSLDDFQNNKVVLISDEAHHLNASTKKMNKEEEECYHSWEQTVERIFGACKDNVMLEFTATCDLANPLIKSAYENKIIFDYPLYKFRADKYSKEIKTLRSDISIMERAIQAIMLSQYRLKVFQDNRLAIKPVVLFKAAKIADSKDFMTEFINTISKLSGSVLENISTLTNNPTMQSAYKYFEDNNISFEQLAQELKEDFGTEHCISANDDSEASGNQLALNSLEDASNPYRAIFEVKKLDEGWDVLNLFDIVRLYETRQSGGKKISPATVAEAQLIGRGARYCPFQINDEQEKYRRKFDSDIDNPLRICEELYYHCQNDSRYIGELNNALREIGIDLDKTVTREYALKDDFKQDFLYKQGYVFINDRVLQSRKAITELLPSIRNDTYRVTLATGRSGEDTVMDANSGNDSNTKTYTLHTTFADIAELNYSIIYKALCRYPIFKFNTLKSYFPNLKSTREFITSKNYLGFIRIDITTRYQNPAPEILFRACASANVLGKIAGSISGIEETFEGTTDFKAYYLHDVFKNKRINVEPIDGSIGYSQNDSGVFKDWRLDLSKEDWYVFDDNYGTSEEKAFVAYFKQYADSLKDKYDKVYLIRNERQLHIYSFDGGERFEPDYLLFLHTDKADGYEQLQIFIEPKGTGLIPKDQWKEEFMLQMEAKAIPVVTFADDNKYKIWGFHFFNHEVRNSEFADDFNSVL